MDNLQRVALGEDARIQDQRQQRVTDSESQQMAGNSPHLDFQDSNLSPALSLMPSHSGLEHNFSEYSLFQQSDMEFAPLRAYPDISMASERFHFPPHDLTTQTLEQASLSQHPLVQEDTVLSEEGASSCSSLSQHSLSPEHDAANEGSIHSPMASITEKGQEISSKVVIGERIEKVTESDIYFLNKDVPAQHLMQILQKDVGMLSSSCSADSSASDTSVKKEHKNTDKLNTDQSLIREGPPGEASVFQQQPQPERDLYLNASKPRLSEAFNVTVGSRSTQPDDSSEALRKELLSEAQRRSCEASQEQKSATTPEEFPTDISEPKPSVTRVNVGSASWTGPFSTGVQQRHREQDLWSSGNQTGIDGSYLGFLPQSQSTPGVFKPPSKSSVKAKFQQLSDIESNKETSFQSRAETSTAQATAPNSEPEHQSQEEPTCDKVQSLPSLTYMQKVDAWRANQSSGKTSLFDTLALQGFTGVSPKKKAYDAVSDSLNRILSQQVVKISQNVAQNSSTAVSGSSSPRREEAVGSAPSDKDNTGSGATQPASPFGRSQSHSSLSTVVMSVKKEQPAEGRTEREHTQTAEELLQPPNTRAELSPLVVSLGHFSDVTLSNSQDSSNSGQKLGTSIGTSSVSLEVDNYDPYWTSKLSTPPPQHKPRELNIEERIPLYLQNLGIDQSPSTILTPFAPRGPIREPEFSPTELCTIKGSTPTKSIQPSEGGTPHKAEFSRSSIQSVDSSVSIPLSQDSVGQALGPGLIRPASSSSDTAALQSELRFRSNPDADPSSQQQGDSSQSPVHSGPALDQAEDLESHEMGQNVEQNAEVSFVSSSAFSDIRKLLSQAEEMVSSRTSAASDRFLSQRKESYTSPFTTEESKTQSSQLWARSSSDSVLTSRERLTVGENIPHAPAANTKQSGVVSRSAGLSLVLNKSAQRAEPEGCSAAPPDRVPPQLPVKPLPPSSPTVTTTVPEETKQSTQEDPEESSTSSPVPVDVMSDRSSDSSLAIRVAMLLQSESPATMVSSTTSVDQEEGRAREWIKQMISGQQCEPLELDQEDRRRIEEIKRDLLLKKTVKTYSSTDTESSAASSLRDLRGQTPFDSVETLLKIADTVKQSSQQLQGLSTKDPQPDSAQGEDIEARVREIAAREGVTLPKTRALTSITISTCRRSTSPSPSTSPAPPISPTTAPLHLNQLTSEDNNKQPSPALTEEEYNKNIETDVALDRTIPNPKSPVRQDTVGGPYEDLSSSSISSEQNRIKEGHSELFKRAEKSPITDSSHISPETEQATTKTGHVSHIRLTLSPKPTDHALDDSVFSRDVSFPQKHFVPLRHSSSTPSSPDEGVGLSSPPEWHEAREQITPRGTDSSKRFTQQQRITSSIQVSPKPLRVETIVPHLLPYKPRGSEELFYVPQAEADLSSTDTTIESTHTGSDDALPPHFSSDVLGHQDPGLDRGVTIRHTEGIYSKRLSKPRFTMHSPGHGGSSDATNEPPLVNLSQTPETTSQVSVAFTRVPLSSNTDAPTTSRRDQGTSPVPFYSSDPPETNRHRSVNLETHAIGHLKKDQGVLPSTSQQNISTIDELWQRFCERRSQEESCPISEREASLLERLERLSRLIHSTRDSMVSETETQQELHTPQKSRQTGSDFAELRKQRHIQNKTNQAMSKYRQGLDNLKHQVEEDSRLLSPAERDASDTLSSTSGSMSTVDTARLVRAFGADRVQRNFRTSSSLSKLYTAINKQKEGKDQRRTQRHKETAVVPPSETSGTDESSVVVDSASSTSTYTLPSHRGPSTSLVSKKAVKLVSKGIQAGDLEIVSNGTRRHTRDVGTTFPSPSDARGPRQSSSSSSLDGTQKALKSPSSKTQKQRKNQKSPSKRYPEGISWFISAEELKVESRKENEPEETSVWRPSSVWFEPLKKHPWREPLRQRQVQDERITLRSESDLGQRGKITSGVVRVSLQDALLASRPEFVSRSRQRMERLALQVEERRLQAMFNREREELFSRPGGPGRLPRPAGTALLRRAVPRKEMIQRSKQIYENLPEVRRRKEEEQRRSEYRSYRLNAQLYNKRITDRVLGRRTAWH